MWGKSKRPTYRSIEVRTDKGIEERSTRYVGDPAERLAQIVVGAILAQPDVVVPSAAATKENCADGPAAETEAVPAAPVDNGDGVIS